MALSCCVESAPIHTQDDVQLDMSSEFRIVQLEQIQSKQDALLEIERDVREIQGMFDDLAFLVEEQGVRVFYCCGIVFFA